METLVQALTLVVSGLVIWGIWRAGRPRPVFVVQVRDGEPHVIIGTVTKAFLERIREVMSAFGIRKATVSGMASGRRISLQFSYEMPPPACQRLRNWWAISGWGPGR